MIQLTEFLLACIGDDEAEANSAIAMRNASSFIYEPTVPDLSFDAFEDLAVPALILGPERALAECESKRQIVELHARTPRDPYAREGWYQAADDAPHVCGVERDQPWPCQTIRLLALPYAGHPDYQQEWKP